MQPVNLKSKTHFISLGRQFRVRPTFLSISLIFKMFRPLISALLASLLVPSTLGCLPPIKRRSSSAYPDLTVGSDGPADPATLGFMIGHFALLVNDLAATQRFYGDALGMRHIFTYNSSEEYTIMYMGHSQGGKNGTGYQTGDDMFSEVYNMEGLIEFIEFKVCHPTSEALSH
jgi:lactoylglutathione lyase